MKKLYIIILILFVIFVAMLLNKKSKINQEVTQAEINQIEQYINKIYMWKEVTNQALPYFQDINHADETWIWEVVKKNIEQYEVSYEQIQEKAKELFGQAFTKTFPKEGTQYLLYQAEEQKYLVTGIGLDAQNDVFLLNKIEKTKEGYQIEIIEYLEDHSQGQELENEETYNVIIKNLKEEEIATVTNKEEEPNKKQIVKENADKFSKKTIDLKKENEAIYIQKVF